MKFFSFFKKQKNLLIISIIINVILLLYLIVNHFGINTKNYSNNEFSLLDPNIADMNIDSFFKTQEKYSLSYKEMKEQVQEIIYESDSDYGFYFEDLNSGAWVGINEKDQFIAASLLKLPIVVAVLKKVETSDLTLDSKITLIDKDLNSMSGDLYLEGIGYEISLEDLIEALLVNSDNTALNALKRQVNANDVREAMLAMGQPMINVSNKFATDSPKDYSNMFRALYFSSYLRRPFSQLLLSFMSETKHNSQLPAGLPLNIKISHKIGILEDQGLYHDCGIVYAKDKPYLICIMSKGNSKQQADKTISSIAEIVYNYVSKD